MRSWATVLSLIVLIVLVVGVVPARAEVPERTWRTIRVGILPSESFVRTGAEVFEEQPGTREARERIGVWKRVVEDALHSLDLVRVVDTATLRERLEAQGAVRQTLALARERFQLGREQYRSLELAPAAEQLDRALELMIASWSDLGDPRAVADVHLYRGLAMMDQGLEAEALVAFRSMWLHDPSRRFQAGYYPSTTEGVMARALDDLVATADLPGVRYPAARLAALARAAEVDALVSITLRPQGSTTVLRVTIFDASTRLRTVDLREDAGDTARTAEVLDRALSRWHGCNLRSEERTYVARARPSRWTLDLSYAHALFLKHDRTRELFSSPGANIGVTYRAGRVLHLFAQLNQMVSIPDANRDLMEPMMTSRLALGAGLGDTMGRLELYARLGLELGVTLSDAQMTRDVACKHFGDPTAGSSTGSTPCDPGQIFTLAAPAVAVGLHGGLGMRWRIVTRWHAQLEAQLAAYVVGKDFPVSDLNFPLTLGAGLGHRF
jgi:hypothetical protein